MYDVYKLSEKYELSDNWVRILLRRVSPGGIRPCYISLRGDMQRRLIWIADLNYDIQI